MAPPCTAQPLLHALPAGCWGFPPLWDSGPELWFNDQLHLGSPVPNFFELTVGVRDFRHFVCLGGTTQDLFAVDVCSCGLFLIAPQISTALVLEERNIGKAVMLAYECLLNESQRNLHPSVNLPGPSTTHQNLDVVMSFQAQNSGWKPGVCVLLVWFWIYVQHGRCGVFPKTWHKHDGIPKGSFACPGILQQNFTSRKKDSVISKY